MSANDPLLSNRQAEILILQAMRWDRPVIGHCLGGQLMSRALGAAITESPQPEIGWQSMAYETDPLVEHWFGADPAPVVIQWHYDAFAVPRGAQRLASSLVCLNQAWCLGPHLAMQFHIEMDADKAQEWARDEDPRWAQAREQYDTVQDSAEILAGIDQHLTQHQAMADHIYRRWLSTTAWSSNYYNV